MDAFDLITIDSNLSNIIRKCVRLNRKRFAAKPWCSSTNFCALKNPQQKFYYDTPIAMSDETDMMPVYFPENKKIISFVYLDVYERNESYERIMENLKHLNHRIVLIINENQCIGNDEDDDGDSDSDDATIVEQPKFENVTGDSANSYVFLTQYCDLDMIADAFASIIRVFLNTGKLLHPTDIERIFDGKKIRNQKLEPKMRCYLAKWFDKKQNKIELIEDCEIVDM